MKGAVRLDAVFDSPLGRVGIATERDALSRLVFLSTRQRLAEPAAPPVLQIVARLRAYFDDPTVPLDIRLCLAGTRFQRRVWRALQGIKPGSVCTYGELAGRLGTSARAVGNACRANPVPLVVPCHRVVASGGIGGFAGSSAGRLVGIKHWLLRHEGIEI